MCKWCMQCTVFMQGVQSVHAVHCAEAVLCMQAVQSVHCVQAI